MAWMSWPRRMNPAAKLEPSSVGIELNASFARAIINHKSLFRSAVFGEDGAVLPLLLNLEQRTPRLGQLGRGSLRRLPHLTCGNFLPFVGESREWKTACHRLTAAEALGLAFGRIKTVLRVQSRCYLSLPAYITEAQANAIREVAEKCGLTVGGCVNAHLAVAADRAAVLMAHGDDNREEFEGVVPLHRSQAPSSADSLIVDVDEHCLTCSLTHRGPEQITVLFAAELQGLGLKHWNERLIDHISDRCVRTCRRDPRDSADAEQSLFEQIDAGLDALKSQEQLRVSVRAAHWYQDLLIEREDLAAGCSKLIRAAVEAICRIRDSRQASAPPRAVWVTHAAGRLPGLAAAIYQNMAEQTSVAVLRPEAPALAAARLAERWFGHDYLDRTIPLSPAFVRPTPVTDQACLARVVGDGVVAEHRALPTIQKRK